MTSGNETTQPTARLPGWKPRYVTYAAAIAIHDHQNQSKTPPAAENNARTKAQLQTPNPLFTHIAESALRP